MSLLLQKIATKHVKTLIIRYEPCVLVISNRKLNIVPSFYDGEQDPAPKFFTPNVQNLLKRLTRPDFTKVFRKRNNQGLHALKTPKYKFLTKEELELEIAKANEKADVLLQIPPVLKIHKPIDEVLSRDPALIGYDTSKYLFTDITFGIANEERIIIERDTDGTLRSCDHDIRKKLNQVYFPITGRKIREPHMFSDEEKFHNLLDRGEYEFVLDRACIQYEPDEPIFQKITSITYQHVDNNKCYNTLRSTRHFGSMTFYLTWHQSIDNLMLEIIQSGFIREAVLLAALRHDVHNDVREGTAAQSLAQEIFTTPLLLSKLERLTEEDIQLDSKCIQCIEKYIMSNSTIKSQHELALQGFKEDFQHLSELRKGLEKAHGNV